jgi:hypothetical protein
MLERMMRDPHLTALDVRCLSYILLFLDTNRMGLSAIAAYDDIAMSLCGTDDTMTVQAIANALAHLERLGYVTRHDAEPVQCGHREYFWIPHVHTQKPGNEFS